MNGFRLVGFLLVIGLMALVCLAPGTAPGQDPGNFTGKTALYPMMAQPDSSLRVWPGQVVSRQEQQLERQSLDLARQYGRAEGREERAKLRDQLSESLRQQFDAQQQRRKAEIEEIEKRLKALRELMQKRDDSKKEIVQRRLEQLLQDADGMGWTTTEPAHGPLSAQPVLPPAPAAPVPRNR